MGRREAAGYAATRSVAHAHRHTRQPRGSKWRARRRAAMNFEKRAPHLRLKLEGWRSRFVLFVVAAAFAALAGRAFFLQAMHTSFLQAKGEARYGRVLEMPASRGPVKDRNGQPLAISTPVESIWVSPEDLELGEGDLSALASALAMDSGELRQKVANKDRQFVYLKR